ncbi:LLM class flavin-dependent oxidoreductase [Alteribacillus sp. JSM 102045]|uniref:LLM class flavin-dependent oxidoreductase n=1 Tax=Alteribacillus sp. JSM 102045 TaxID=1562101 RepID=UPI0035C18523
MEYLEFSIFDLVHWPHAGQKLEGEEQIQIYENHMEEWLLAERMGFDTIWLGEHHFTEYSMTPSPNIMLSTLAQRTKNIKIGNMINALNFNDPWRMAEEFAMLDILSKGRLLIGLGRSADVLEYEKFGMPLEDGRPRFKEGLELIKKAFSQEVVDHDGQFFYVKGGSLTPRPIQKPYPQIYTTCLSPETHAWAAKEGYPVSTLFLPPDRASESYNTYMSERKKNNLEVDPKNYLMARHVYVAETKEKAMEDAKEPMLEFLRLFQNAAVPDTQEELDSFPENFKFFTQFFAPFFGGELTYEGLIESGLFICGDPETVAEEIQFQQEQIGFGQLMCWMSFGNLSHNKVMNSMELFGKHVMPKFKSSVKIS